MLPDISNPVRLAPGWPSLLYGLPTIGPSYVLTRNSHAIFGQIIQYPALSISRDFTQAHDPEGKLSFSLSHWHEAYAYTETMNDIAMRCIEFVDNQGLAIHKLCLSNSSDEQAYLEYVDNHILESLTPWDLLHVRPTNHLDLGYNPSTRCTCSECQDTYASPTARAVDRLLREAVSENTSLFAVLRGEAATSRQQFQPSQVFTKGSWLCLCNGSTALHLNTGSLRDISTTSCDESLAIHFTAHDDIPVVTIGVPHDSSIARAATHLCLKKS